MGSGDAEEPGSAQSTGLWAWDRHGPTDAQREVENVFPVFPSWSFFLKKFVYD